MKESFSKLHKTIHQILAPKISIKIHKKCIAEPYYFLVNDTTLASDNPLRFRESFLKYNKSHDNL